MSKIIYSKGLSENLHNNVLLDGQILFTTDTYELYIDFIDPTTNELVRKPITNEFISQLLYQHIESLNKVENKSSEEIRNEITYDNVVSALGYVPSIGTSVSLKAEDINYDNQKSEINAENVQSAIDILNEKNTINEVNITTIENDIKVVITGDDKINKIWKTDENGIPAWREELKITLYDNTGNNEDGAMTQAAVTNLVGDIGSILDKINRMEV